MESPLRLHFTTLDVFTAERFTGNSLAVVRLPSGKHLSQEQKQTIAREFNYSETVILHENDNGNDLRLAQKLDIFLTTAEIPFAGHPTIGTACLLSTANTTASTDENPQGTLSTKAGPIPYVYDLSSKTAFIEIPHNVHIHPAQVTPTQAAAAGVSNSISSSIVGTSPIVSIVQGMTFALVELPSVEVLSLASGSVNAKLLPGDLDSPWSSKDARLGTYYYVLRGMKGDGTVMISSRMINGTFEDPATGSAASAMAAFLAKRLAGNGEMDRVDGKDDDEGAGKRLRRVKFEIEQGVDMGRRSRIQIEIQMDADSGEFEKIVLGGSAVEVMKGTIEI